MPVKATKVMKEMVDNQVLDRHNLHVFPEIAEAKLLDKRLSNKNNNLTHKNVCMANHTFPELHHDLFDLM